MDSLDEYNLQDEDDRAFINIPKISTHITKTVQVELSRVQRMMISQIREMKQIINDFTYRGPISNQHVCIQDKCNIFLFGPTGSGKSSLVKTLFMSQRGYMDEMQKQLLSVNENTEQFIQFTLKESRNFQVIGKKTLNYTRPEINIIDTRGQILLNDQETKQLELMVQGKVKNMSTVRQRNYRKSYMLWEFWKRESELFPKEILSDKSSFQTLPQCMLLVFDGSLLEVPNGDDEIRFYKNMIKKIVEAGYGTPQIVLTHLDIVESNQNLKQTNTIDSKIQSVVDAFGVPRNCIHFIENYKSSKDEISIQYYGLRLLNVCIKVAQQFMQRQDISNDRFCQFL